MTDRKKMSAKEIFRTLVFQYHLDETIPVELLAGIVSHLLYPADPTGEAHNKYKLLLTSIMREHNNE